MIGKTLGHYRIEEKIGAGGMGEVYRARDERLDRDVALKVLPAQALADEAARARLLREARTASALNHPHICTIYEVGEADGQTYIAMELVAGRPLSALIPSDGLPVETLLRYGAQVADALAHAHERSVIHRDLKSANVLISPEGRAKVLDFGLAKRLRDEELAEATRSTISLEEKGRVAGTLHYMAPEVLRGEPADARSDLWALGVMLYEMAAGALPFQGQTGYELSSAILREPPGPLPQRVPAGLRAVIQRCLAKEPGQRYQRASELRAALEALQSDTAVTMPVSTARPARRLWLWALATGALLVGIGITIAALRGIPFNIGITKIEKPSQPRLSTGGKPSANAEANEYFEKAMLFLTKQYDLPRGRQMLERALELDSRFVEARAWYGYTHYTTFDGGYSNDTSWLYRAEEELRRALEDDANSASAHAFLATVYMNQGRKELTPLEVEKALAIDPNDFRAPVTLSMYHWSFGDYAAGELPLQQVLARDPLYLIARLILGILQLEQGDQAGAIRAHEKILEQDPQNVYAIRFLARSYLYSGEVKKARLTLERLRPADRQAYRARLDHALLLALEGKRAEALKEMDSEVLRFASAHCWWVTLTPAEVYAVLGETQPALEWLERAVRNGDERLAWFQRDPLLANLRDLPRFQQILESIAYRRQQRAQSRPQR